MNINAFLSRLFHSRIPFLVIITILLTAAVSQGSDSKKAGGFVIDSKRPYIDIVFDKIGERHPVFPGESNQGLWLRLRNNCIYTVNVQILTDPNKNQGKLVVHEVFSTSNKDLLAGLLGSSSEKSAIAQPQGYRGIDVVNTVPVMPSQELLFSVPLKHVARDWAIRIEVDIEIPGPTRGIQPRIFVEYFFAYLPDEAKALSDRMLAGNLR
jgi:hypothetical protein